MTTKFFNQSLIELKPGLSSFAKRLTQNRFKAEDLLQETFYRALKYREKFSADTCLKSWTFRIMQNIFINDYRIKNRFLFLDGHIIVSNSFLNPEAHYNLIDINKEISTLNKKLKLTFKMYLNGFKYYEIAEHLQISIGTAKSRVFYAKEYLKRNLKEFSYETDLQSDT